MTDYFEPTKVYSYLWNKYRPVLLKLMIASSKGEQHYTFSPQEFRNINLNHRGGFMFTLQLFKSKSVNDIRDSPVAQDLLYVLTQSKTALQLAEEDTYEFSLDKRFVLSISRPALISENAG